MEQSKCATCYNSKIATTDGENLCTKGHWEFRPNPINSLTDRWSDCVDYETPPYPEELLKAMRWITETKHKLGG